MNPIKSKRGQFYLFTAVILIALLGGIFYQTSQQTDSEDIFDELQDNFIRENTVVINYALYANASVRDSIDSFALSFLNYARQRDPNFGFVILLKNRNETIIMNRLKDETISLKQLGDPLLPGQDNVTTFNSSHPSFDVEFSDLHYIFKFAENPEMQLKMLFNSYENANIYIQELY